MGKLPRRDLSRDASMAAACAAPCSGLLEQELNTIFVLSHDHGWDALRSTDNPVARTPTVDCTARADVLSADRFVNTPIWWMSKANFLRSLYGRACNVGDLMELCESPP